MAVALPGYLRICAGALSKFCRWAHPPAHLHTGPPRPLTTLRPLCCCLQVSAMVSLVEAYQGGAVRDFERILRTHRAAVMGDPFIAQYMADLLANVRTQVGGGRGGCGRFVKSWKCGPVVVGK